MSDILKFPQPRGLALFAVIAIGGPAPDGHVPYLLRKSDGTQLWRVYRDPAKWPDNAGWSIGDEVFVQQVDRSGKIFNWGEWGCSINYRIDQDEN